MGMFPFGSGTGFARVDKGGGLIVSRRVFTAQSIDLKIDAPIKEMHGGKRYPEDVASGSGKIGGKIKQGKFVLGSLNDMVLNGAASTGHIVPVLGEGGSLGLDASSGTVTAAQGSGGITDMGVVSAVTGVSLLRTLNTSPEPGKYFVDETTGTYSFNSTETGTGGRANRVRLDYRIVNTTGGLTIEMGNPLQGDVPSVELCLTQSRNVKGLVAILYRAVFHGLDIGSKVDAYMEPDLTYSCFSDDAKDSPGQFSYTDDD